MNTVEQFIMNTIDTYVEPLIEGFRRGRGKPKPPAQAVQNDVSKITNATTVTSSVTFWVVVIIVIIIALIITNQMNYWTVNGAKDTLMSIPSSVSSAFSSATSVFSSKTKEATGGTISEVAEVADISVTQALL